MSVTDQAYQRIADVPAGSSVVTIGAFDGVHRGHQHLLNLARSRANELQSRVVVVTFEPLPIQLFRPGSFPGRIVTNRRRRELLHAFGADVVVELQFDHDMAMLSAEEFVEQVISIGPLRELLVGQDFALGHNRTGTPARLAELTGAHGTTVRTVHRIDFLEREVSSTAIRQLIIDGYADDASQLLGHRFQVRGEVVRCSQLGRAIGFPTANVWPPNDLVQLQDGIYASLAQIGGEEQMRPSMTYIGKRPAINTGARMIETHLLDFDDDIYGHELTTWFVRHLRQDSDFPDLETMRAQLTRDEMLAREVLAGRVNSD